MAKRHDDALMIQAGACNGVGIARALHEAYREAMAENIGTDAMNRDPAVRLILHQLCHLAGIYTSDMEHEKAFNWARDTNTCRALASDRTLEITRAIRPVAA